MKKISCVLLMALGLSSTLAYAADNGDTKLNTVKQMYQYYARHWNDDSNTLEHFADSSLKQALRKMDQYEKHHVGYASCIDYDPLTDSQDPPVVLRGKLPKLSLLPSGKVKASMDRGTVVITYALNCTSNQCKISDLFSADSGSLKQRIRKYCR